MNTPAVVTTEQEPGEREALLRAAEIYDRFERERVKFRDMLEAATRNIKDAKREIELLTMELAQTKNNLANLQATMDDNRQEISDHRAFFEEQRSLLGHVMNRYDTFEIPFRIRRRPGKKNGTAEQPDRAN